MRLKFNKHTLTENDKIAIINVSGAFIIKGFSLIISLISLPLYIKYFNNDSVLGLWFTLLSILTWILTFDFGIGNGLRNKLVEAINKNDSNLVKIYIASSYTYLGIIVSVIIIFLIPVIYFLNWSKILNISNDIVSPQTLLLTVFIVFFTISFQFFLRLITFILYSLQKSALNNILIFTTSIIQFLFLLIYNGNDIEKNLVILSVVHFISVIGPLVCATIYIFSRKLKYAKPKFENINLSIGKSIISLGGKFFWIQIMYLGITGTNTFLITNLIGPSIVVEYQVYFKIYTLAATVITLALTPFWSLITKAKTENDWIWIKKYYNYTSFVVLLVFFGQSIIIILNTFIFKIWLGENYISVNILFATLFAIYGSLYAVQAILSTFANGFNIINTQLIIYTIGFLIKISILYGFEISIDNFTIILIIDSLIFLFYCFFEYANISKYIKLHIS